MSINILYLNPLSFTGYNQAFADSLKHFKRSDTALDVASFQPTVDLPITLNELGYRAYESLIMGPTVQVARLGVIGSKKYNAMVIGCFYDPALLESRAISGPMSVIGPCQASCQIASTLANKFSIIIGMDYWQDQMEATVYAYGYKDYLTSFETVNIPASELLANPEITMKAICDASIQAVNKGAEAIILGCTLETGTYKTVIQALYNEFKTYIPVIDPSIASLKMAELQGYNTAEMGVANSRVHGMSMPAEADLKKYGIFQTPYPLADVISIPSS